MTRMVERRRLPWPASDAADLVLDWARDGEWRAEVVSMEATPPGPSATGQRIVERLRVSGFPVTASLRVLAADARSVEFAGGNATVASRGRRTVRADEDGGSTVELELELRPRGLLALLAPVLAPGYRRMHRANADALAALAARHEAGNR